MTICFRVHPGGARHTYQSDQRHIPRISIYKGKKSWDSIHKHHCIRNQNSNPNTTKRYQDATSQQLTSTIPTGRTAPHTTTMTHPHQHLVGIHHNLPRCHGLQRSHHAHAAIFTFLGGIVKCCRDALVGRQRG